MVSLQLVHGGRLEKHFGPGWGGRDSLCNTRGVALEGQEERPLVERWGAAKGGGFQRLAPYRQGTEALGGATVIGVEPEFAV